MAKFNPTISGTTSLLFCSFLGSSGEEDSRSLVVESPDVVYIAGNISSTSFTIPTTTLSYNTSYGGGQDAFLAKLNTSSTYTGTRLLYFSYLGGSGDDIAFGLALGSAGKTYLTGLTASTTNFPVITSTAYQSSYGGGTNDAFITQIDTTISGSNGLLYSSYLGGSNNEQGYSVVVDSGGNAYVAGFTASSNFPTTPGVYQPSARGGTDGFVLKLNPTLSGSSGLIYSTYLGGNGDDGVATIVLSNGNVYLASTTSSTDYPTTVGAYQSSNQGSWDVAVTKLSADGSGLVYSTYLGGSGDDQGRAITVNASGEAYVSGYTSSSNFPIITPTYQSTLKGAFDIFVAKLSVTGTLQYSTYLGGTANETSARDLALDSSGNLYVAGSTSSTDFPIITGTAYQTTNRGSFDTFVSRLNSSLTTLQYSTYLGGNGDDNIRRLVIDGSNILYLTGDTASTNFPTSTNPLAYQTTLKGPTDAYITKLDPSVSGSSGLKYSSYLGGTGNEFSRGLAVENNGGIVYLSSSTTSSNFPTTTTAYQTSLNGSQDIFLSRLNTTISGTTSLLYSSYLGGEGVETVYGLALDSSNIVYLTGDTNSLTFPVTNGAYQTANNGGSEAFLIKFNPTISGTAGLLYSSYLGGSGEDRGVMVRVDTLGNPYLAGATSSLDFPATGGAFQTANQGGNDVFVTKFNFSQLVFTTQPGGASAPSNLNPQPVVKVQDPAGNTLTSFNGVVSLTIKSGTGTAGATLGGTTSISATSGVATFTNLSIDKPGIGYILTAHSGTLDTTDSFPLVITGSRTISAIAGNQQSTVTSTTFAQTLKARVLDSAGNPVSGTVVTFSGPSSGAGADFNTSLPGTQPTATATTDSNGYAQTSVFNASPTTGSYLVKATVSGAAAPALFTLSNTNDKYDSDIALTLDPLVSGPNPISSSVKITATLKKHAVTPISNTQVTFTIVSTDNSANASTIITTATTDSNGQADIKYSRTVTSTDNITASVTVNGLPIQSDVTRVYWDAIDNPVSISTVQGRFFAKHCTDYYTCDYFDALVTDTAVFSQTFSNLVFNPGSNPGITGLPTDLNVNTLPFTNVVYRGDDYSYLGKIEAQGNGYFAGQNFPGPHSDAFNAVFTGQFVISAAGPVTFTINHNDGFILGIGGSGVTASPNNSNVSFDSNPITQTVFERLPVVSMRNLQTSQYYDFNQIITFTSPGVYPFEVDYTQGEAPGASFALYQSNGVVPPLASVALTNTITPDPAVGTTATYTATVKGINGQPAPNPTGSILLVKGANPQQLLPISTTIDGKAIFTYTASKVGTDSLQVINWVRGMPIYSNIITQPWSVGSPGTTLDYNCSVNNWLSSPTNPSDISGVVGLVAGSNGINAGTSGIVVQYYPANTTDYSKVVTLTSTPITPSVSSGSTLLNFDTTTIPNGAYILRVVTDDGTSSCKSSLTLVNVVGENKPGRVTFSVNDFTVPVAGLPIVIGRTYDSLERNQIGDFGNGWKLSIGSPKLEVNPANYDVTLTLLDGRRVKFAFAPTPPSPLLGFLLTPQYTAEPGVYGSLTAGQGGCSLIATAGSSGGYMCFLSFTGANYAPTSYIYRDPYGRRFEMNAATGKLTALTDMNGNKLSYDDGGIKVSNPDGALNNNSYIVTFTRNTTTKVITQITDATGNNYTYTYSGGTTGDLINVTLPGTSPVTIITYTYFTGSTILNHLFKSAYDPRGNQQVVTDYYYNSGNSSDPMNGRLITVTQPIAGGNPYTTTYAYTLPTTTVPTYTTTTTNVTDGGVMSQSFNGYGLLITDSVDIRNNSAEATNQRVTSNLYDASRNITQTTLPNVNGPRTIQYKYDSRGNRTNITNPLTFANTTAYNEYGGPNLITSAVGVTQSVGYDDNFLPNAVSDGVGYMGGYSFDSKGSVMTRLDGNQKATIFTYDAFGNKTSEADPLLNTTSYQYDNMGRMTAMTDTLGVVSNYEYDALGFMKVMTTAVGTTNLITTSYTYDASRNKTQETDPLGRVTNYQYDNLNRLTLITYTNSPYYSGNITQSFSYDFRGNKLTETDQSGRITTYNYDLAGQLITTTYASNTSDFARQVKLYDAAGRVISSTNAFTTTTIAGIPYTSNFYDAADRLVSMTNQIISPTSYFYDAAGRTTSVRDANGRDTSYQYDQRNRVITTTYPAYGGPTISTTQSYDPAGRLATKTDGAGKVTSYQYDEAGRLKQVLLPISSTSTNITNYQYDGLGRLVSMIDGNGHSTSFEYDPLGRQTKKILPDLSFEQYGYDKVGNQTSTRLADGNTNTYQYDPLNRLRQLTYFSGQTLVYSYTRTGQKLAVQDSNRGWVQYQYDGRDRVTTITQPTGYKMEYRWDANNNRTVMTATAGSTVKATSYTYDDALRLKTVKGADDGGGQSQYFYDPVGLRTKLTLPNNISVTYEYDTLNRMRAITQTQGASTVLASYRYDLGLAGNRTKVTEKDNSSTEWTYDDSYRLTSEVRKNTLGTVLTTTNYTYDKTGNRQTMAINGQNTSYSYNELDQLVSDGTKQYSYDRRGNLTQITGGTKYKWDGADRLISATVTGGTALYVYDADGRRVKQTQGTTVTNFLWDEQSAYGDVVFETDGTNSTSYTLGGTELLSQKRSSAANAEYFLMDGHSGIRSLTNNSGSVTENYRYDAFGNLQNFSGTPNTKYLYTGQQYDSLTSLYDLRARYYNPSQGRFLGRDSYQVDFNNPIELNSGSE